MVMNPPQNWLQRNWRTAAVAGAGAVGAGLGYLLNDGVYAHQLPGIVRAGLDIPAAGIGAAGEHTLQASPLLHRVSGTG
ncbi:MAG: hypothetical protein HYY37_02615 [Candidatus Aenigmarchaeota archaeon]|nr:hypothetical protein [Candidatus Aenigmarchaeota archaeon]